jgi:hypothetical protein
MLEVVEVQAIPQTEQQQAVVEQHLVEMELLI